MRLTTDTLEVWSVGGGGGTPCLEVRQPLASQIQRALGVRKACLLDVAVTGAPTTMSPPPAGGEASASPPVVSWGLELLVLAAAGAAGGSGRDGDGGAEATGGDGGELSVHAVRVSSGEASWVGSSVSVQVCVMVVLERKQRFLFFSWSCVVHRSVHGVCVTNGLRPLFGNGLMYKGT